LRHTELIKRVQTLRTLTNKMHDGLALLRTGFARVASVGSLDIDSHWPRFEAQCAQLLELRTKRQDLEARERARTALLVVAQKMEEMCSRSVQLELATLAQLEPLRASSAHVRDSRARAAQEEESLWDDLGPAKEITASTMKAAHDLKVRTAQLRSKIDCALFSGDTSKDASAQLSPLLEQCRKAEVAFTLALRKVKASESFFLLHLSTSRSRKETCWNVMWGKTTTHMAISLPG
jgi:hypothetical protein